MSEQNQDPQSQNNETPQQGVSVHTIYIKDASFESPNAPNIFRENQQPNVQLNVGVDSHQLADNTHEVTLTVTVTAKMPDGDKTAFLCEVQQAGVFTVQGFEREQLGPILGIYCPNVLFPYAREATSSMVGKGGFPQLMLEPVNFEALYANHMHEQQQAEA